MINKDKFGNTIYPNNFKVLLENGNLLLKHGYTESFNKPNLFFKKTPEGSFYMDMRSTNEVPMWEDTNPLFYAFFNQEIPMWKRRRLMKQELIYFYNNKIPFRLSFEFGTDESFSELNLYIDIDIEEGIFDWADGYCRVCDRDFQNEGEFCSKECEEKFEEDLKHPCRVCNKKINWGELVYHHVSYFPVKEILVHRSCHNLIHKTDKHSHLKPSKEETDKFYKK